MTSRGLGGTSVANRSTMALISACTTGRTSCRLYRRERSSARGRPGWTAPFRLAPGWLPGRLPRRRGRDRARDGIVGRERESLAVVTDLERLPGEQRVGRLPRLHLHPQPATLECQTECEPGDRLGQSRSEAEVPVVTAHAAEAHDDGDPRARERGDVDAVASVVLEVVEVHERRLAQVVVGKLEMADLGCDDGLGAGGQR